jgi:DHA2 family multidrug resistance protein
VARFWAKLLGQGRGFTWFLTKPAKRAATVRIERSTMPADTTAPSISHAIQGTALLIVTVCAATGTLMQSLDTTIANVALPYMQGTVGASQEEINWVLTSYIVSAAIMTAPTGFLAARFGRTRLFVTSILGFTAASILCGMSQSLTQIVLARILQGMFGAALVPLAQSIMYELYPGERRGPAMAIWGIGVQVGPIFGPILGGWLTQHYSWRWVFYVNVPFGLIAAAGLALFMKDEPAPATKPKLAWVGFASLSIAVGALQIMLDRGEQMDWFSSPEIIIEASISCLAFYIFLVHSFLAPAPFLSPKLFTDVNFVLGLFFVFIIGLILFATLALLAPFLQELLNYPVITAGLVLAPRGLGTMLSMALAGRLVNRLGARPLVAAGFVCSAYSLYLMTKWNPDISEQAIMMAGVVQGLAVGLVFVPLSTMMFATMAPRARTEAAGVFSLVRNLGSSIGIATTGALLTFNTQVNHEQIGAAVSAFNRAMQSGSVFRYWNPHTLAGAGALNQEVTRQASFIAYIDDFQLMFILSLAALPLCFFLRPSKAAPVSQGHAPAMD